MIPGATATIKDLAQGWKPTLTTNPVGGSLGPNLLSGGDRSLDTTPAAFRETISSETINQSPLSGRNFENLTSFGLRPNEET